MSADEARQAAYVARKRREIELDQHAHALADEIVRIAREISTEPDEYIHQAIGRAMDRGEWV